VKRIGDLMRARTVRSDLAAVMLDCRSKGRDFGAIVEVSD